MRDKISTIIMILIVLGIIGVTGIFGYILYDELTNLQQTVAEDFQTTFDDDTSVAAIENEVKAPEVIENSLNNLHYAGTDVIYSKRLFECYMNIGNK